MEKSAVSNIPPTSLILLQAPISDFFGPLVSLVSLYQNLSSVGRHTWDQNNGAMFSPSIVFCYRLNSLEWVVPHCKEASLGLFAQQQGASIRRQVVVLVAGSRVSLVPILFGVRPTTTLSSGVRGK